MRCINGRLCLLLLRSISIYKSTNNSGKAKYTENVTSKDSAMLYREMAFYFAVFVVLFFFNAVIKCGKWHVMCDRRFKSQHKQ